MAEDRRLKHLKEDLEAVAQSERHAGQGGWLCGLRGVDTVTAMTIVSELHDISRFRSARELMSYLGLTPSEHSSGARRPFPPRPWRHSPNTQDSS